MPVPYTGTVSKLIDAFAGHLAATASVQSLLGVSTAAAARALIIEGEGSVLDEDHLIIGHPGIRFSRTPGGAFTGLCDLSATYISPPTSGDTAAEAIRRAWNAHGVLLGAVLAFAPGLLHEVSSEPPTYQDSSDGISGWYETTIIASVLVLPEEIL